MQVQLSEAFDAMLLSPSNAGEELAAESWEAFIAVQGR